jgi:hypothetical protein
MTTTGRTPMAWCSGYGGGKMEMRLSGGESVQGSNDLFIVVEGESQWCRFNTSVSAQGGR